MMIKPAESGGGVVFVAFMPHAPVLIPDVGRKELKPAAASVAGMKLAAARLKRRQPETVVVISPHSPRTPGAFGIWSDSRLRGDFSEFGAPNVALDWLPKTISGWNRWRKFWAGHP